MTWVKAKLGSLDVERHATLKCSICGEGFLRPLEGNVNRFATIWMDREGRLLCTNSCASLASKIDKILEAHRTGAPRPSCPICSGMLVKITNVATGIDRLGCGGTRARECDFEVALP